MSNYESNIDINKLVSDVKQEISEKGYTNDDVLFSAVQGKIMFGTLKHSNYLAENIYNLYNHHNVSAYRSFPPKGPFSFITLPLKRIMRKIVSPYVEPIVGDQNIVNKLIVSSLADLYLNTHIMQKRIEFLEEENNRLKNEISSERMEK